MSWTLIHTDALPSELWKNGGGTTRTLAVEPAGSGFGDFRWRVSIADVRESGSFSVFPDVDRTIVLLGGSGVELMFGDGSRTMLRQPFAPYAFAGDADVSAYLPDGPVRDLNVMTRRGRASARVAIWRAEAVLSFPIRESVFFCAQGAFQICPGPVLAAGIAVRMHEIRAQTILTPASSDAVLIGVLIDE